MKAFHYLADVKGETKTRFYHEMGRVSDSAARAFGAWINCKNLTLWPSSIPGVYTAKWFDEYSDTFRESTLTIVEEV